MVILHWNALLAMMHWTFLLLLTFSQTDQSPQRQAIAHPKSGATLQGTIAKGLGAPALFFADGHPDNGTPLATFQSVELRHPTKRKFLPAPFTIQAGPLENLKGTVRKIDQKAILLDSILGAKTLPVTWIRSMDGWSEGIILRSDSFNTLDRSYRTTGDVKLSDTGNSLPTSAWFASADSSLSFDVETPATAGKFSCYYFDAGKQIAGESRTVRFQFGKENDCLLTVDLGAALRTCSAHFTEHRAAAKSRTIPRRAGWHLLAVQWDDESILASIDNQVILADLQSWTGRPIRNVAFTRKGGEGTENSSSDRFLIDDLFLVENCSSVARIGLDPGQMDLLDRNGDQWFGSTLDSDDSFVFLRETESRQKKFRWSEIRSLRFPDQKSVGLHWSGEIGDLQLIDGSKLLVSLDFIDSAGWHCQHPALSKPGAPFDISEDLIARWTPRLQGTRTELVNSPFHLGNKLVSEFEHAAPDGLKQTFTADVKNPDLTSSITLWIKGIEDQGPKSPFAAELKAGFLVTELHVNGKRVAVLNPLVATRTKEPMELRIPLAKSLRQGKNNFELRVVKGWQDDEYDESEVQRIALEQGDEAPTNSKNEPLSPSSK